MCNKEEAMERIDGIIAQIDDFWTYAFMKPLEDECDDPDSDFRTINNIYNLLCYGNHSDNIAWAAGASRIAIWDTRYCDYVMKIALTSGDEDYCTAEVRNYECALEYGAAEAFAWTDCIYTARELGSDRGIYAMEFVDCDEELLNDASWNYGFSNYCAANDLDENDEDAQDRYYDDCCCDMCGDNEELYDYAESTWSGKLASAVYKVIRDCQINDLHSGNMGFRDRMVVLTDYAGW